MVPTYARLLKKGQEIEVRDGGGYSADLVHVDDVVQAILLAASENAGGVFNVGSGAVHSVLEIAEALAEVMGASSNLIKVISEEEKPIKSGFVGLDITRARKELGYRPMKLREGLRRYVESIP